jgi:hypothetical protein
VAKQYSHFGGESIVILKARCDRRAMLRALKLPRLRRRAVLIPVLRKVKGFDGEGAGRGFEGLAFEMCDPPCVAEFSYANFVVALLLDS